MVTPPPRSPSPPSRSDGLGQRTDKPSPDPAQLLQLRVALPRLGLAALLPHLLVVVARDLASPGGLQGTEAVAMTLRTARIPLSALVAAHGVRESAKDLKGLTDYASAEGIGTSGAVIFADSQPARIGEFQTPTCDALRSNGQDRCRSTALYPNGRCRFHGGPSTGPRTPEGKARAMASLVAFNARRTKAAKAQAALAELVPVGAEGTR